MKNFIAVIICFYSISYASSDEAESKDERLIRARRNLLLAEETFKRVQSEREHLYMEGNLPANALSDYNLYLERIARMVVLHQRRVRRLDADIANTEIKENPLSVPDYSPALENKPSPTDDLNREFADSLGAFDEFIIQELSLLDKQKVEQLEDEELSGLAAEAAQAVQRLARSGIDLNVPAAGGNSEIESESVAATNLSESQRETGLERGGVPVIVIRETPDDDDIVSRQLREAAETETNPELKKRLWREYDAYKRAVRRELTPSADSVDDDSDGSE